ncbi:hypothetical protein [Pleomorphovibrio marinus]|uniref:hypothetical protein n=1 Tax=Pleomorphovibrio marinus TaxID=2164132 RepID=UPI000E0B23E1|nr:hypothetical protein [Pleomorphovibrio marinus]
MISINKLILAMCLLVAIFSCKEDDGSPNLGNKLIANAGMDREVPLGEAVELDGSGSKDGNNKSFSFLWTLKSKPENSNAALTKAIEMKPLITPDQLGVYEIELKIANETGESKATVKLTAVEDSQGGTVILDRDILQNRVLVDIHEDPSIPDYLVTVNLGVKAALTVQPGVVIAFEEKKSLKVFEEGTIIAKGSPDKKIQFIGKLPNKGYWAGIISQSSNPLNILEHVEVSDAGSNTIYPVPQATALSLTHNAYLNISHTTIHRSQGHGIWINQTANFDFGNNVFRENDGINLLVPISKAHKVDSESHFETNNAANNVIELVGNVLDLDVHVTWNKLGQNTKYRVKEDVVVKSDLSLSKGVKLEVAPNKFLRVDGSLHAKGSQDDPIIVNVWPSGGEKWGGLVVHSGSDQNRLEWVEIRNAGNNQRGYGMDKSAAVGIDNAGDGGKLHLANTKIIGSNSYGLYIEPGAHLGDCVNLTFTGIKGRTIALPASLVSRLNEADLVFSQNQLPSVEILGFSLQATQETVWAPLPDGIPFFIPNQLDVISGLKLLPGVTLEFTQHAMLAILQNGYLEAIGTAQKKITFKGAEDQKGFWRGVIFKSSSDQNIMEHTLIAGAGGQALPWSGGRSASIGVFPGGAGLQLKNSKITKGGGWGILVDTSFGAHINPDAESLNLFEDISNGKIIHL